MNYEPDTRDTSADPSVREMVGQGRTIPSSFSLAEQLQAAHEARKPASDQQPEFLCGDAVAAFVQAVEVRERYCKRSVVLQEDALQAMVEDKVGVGNMTTAAAVAQVLVELGVHAEDRKGGKLSTLYKAKRVLRIKTSAHEMLLEVRKTLMHGHAIFLGHWASAAFMQVPDGKPVEPGSRSTPMASTIVGYDQLGNFEVAPPGLSVRKVTGEWLMSEAIEMLVVDGAPEAAK